MAIHAWPPQVPGPPVPSVGGSGRACPGAGGRLCLKGQFSAFSESAAGHLGRRPSWPSLQPFLAQARKHGRPIGVWDVVSARATGPHMQAPAGEHQDPRLNQGAHLRRCKFLWPYTQLLSHRAQGTPEGLGASVIGLRPTKIVMDASCETTAGLPTKSPFLPVASSHSGNMPLSGLISSCCHLESSSYSSACGCW